MLVDARLFYLKTYSFEGLQLLVGKIENESAMTG